MAALKRDDDPLADEYALAAQAAEDAARVARGCGEYPLLSTGDINIYSLFVERASHLARADGIVVLLTPSGIAADKGAAPFFRSIATTGRLGALFDFENKKRSEAHTSDLPSLMRSSFAVFCLIKTPTQHSI